MSERKPFKAFLRKPDKARGVCPKIYLVFLSVNVVLKGKQPDDYLIGVCLTAAAAQRIVDENPGAYTVKVYASKN